MELTDGTLLGGRVTYHQPRRGYRTGIEPILLAASVPARPGERVFEAGCGAGAGLLCLLARLPHAAGTGLEREPALAALARANLQLNAMTGGVVMEGDVRVAAEGPAFDHVMANPPWHAADAPCSPDALRDGAKRATPGLLGEWIPALARRLRRGGSLTLVVPAGAVPPAMASIAGSGCGSICVLPLWPRRGMEARIVLLRARRFGRGSCRMLPGLVLHEGPGFSAETRAILWDGAALPIG